MLDLENQVGRIHSFETFGAVDGPGVRFVVFMQGCPLRCLYCHNPDTWDVNGGFLITAKELVGKIIGYKSFLHKGGVTFSGGEPLLQSDFLLEVIPLLREQKIHVAIDTSGAIPLFKCQAVIDVADLVILDIKEVDTFDYRVLTGQMQGQAQTGGPGNSSENAFVLLDYCKEIKKPVWIRQVLLPGYTLKEEKLHRLAQKLCQYNEAGIIEKIELLPFHKLGEYKWEGLGVEYKLTNVDPPTPKEIVYAKEIVKSHALPIE